MTIVLLAGLLGGVIRGLMGFVKHQYSYKNVPFRLPYFLFMVGVSGGIGGVAAIAIQSLGLEILGTTRLTPAIALIIGYAGGDFLENIFKIVFKKPEWYKFPGK